MSAWVRWFLALIVLLAVSSSAFVVGVTTERSGLLPGSLHTEPDELTEQFGVFWQAWELVQENFVDRTSVDPRNMTYGAIEGMLASLGDTGHTRFLTPEDAQLQMSDLSGQFFGIGAELGQRDGYPMIVAPLDGSPAERAGIRAGDILVQVDGEPVMGMALDRVVRMVRGPEGTPVTLTVIHPGEGSLTEITIVRARIQLRPVSWAMLPGTDLAHIRISQFSANTNRDLLAALKEARTAGARGLVMDVRSNTGGLLDQAISVTSQFLTGGNVLVERDARGNQKPHPVESGGQATDLPMVVLVNLGTASAAEIFSGAMQDHQRGQVVGDTTFGTGTVLSTFSLNDGSALLLGTSEWLTPKGRQIWKQGIEPDVKVPLPPGATAVSPRRAGEMTAEQLRSSDDAQLLKALDLLESQMAQEKPSQ